MKKIEKDSKAENIARYFYQEDSNKKYLFCVLSEKSKLTMIFSHEVQDYSFLVSDKMNSVFVVLENGIIGIEFPVNIRYEFKAGRLIFQIHSLNLFEELVNLFFLDSTQVKAGISSKNKFEGLGIFIRSKNGEKDSFFYKIRRILNSSLIAFLIGDDEKIWGLDVPIIQDAEFSDYLTLENKSFEANYRNVCAFYLNSAKQSCLLFSKESMKDNKNVFLSFLFTSYVFYEDWLCRKLFSFYGQRLLSIFQIRESLNFYINYLTQSNLILTWNNFSQKIGECGFFMGEKTFLFFNLKKYHQRIVGEENVFLLNEKCFVGNISKNREVIHNDWGIALFPGACVPLKVDRKYKVVIYPDKNNEIQFNYETVKISVKMENNEIDIDYNFLLLEEISVVVSPARVLKIQRNGEYAPLIVKKNQDCVGVSCNQKGKIKIYLNS
jgi:hypothetical protein